MDCKRTTSLCFPLGLALLTALSVATTWLAVTPSATDDLRLVYELVYPSESPAELQPATATSEDGNGVDRIPLSDWDC